MRANIRYGVQLSREDACTHPASALLPHRSALDTLRLGMSNLNHSSRFLFCEVKFAKVRKGQVAGARMGHSQTKMSRSSKKLIAGTGVLTVSEPGGRARISTVVVVKGIAVLTEFAVLQAAMRVIKAAREIIE